MTLGLLDLMVDLDVTDNQVQQAPQALQVHPVLMDHQGALELLAQSLVEVKVHLEIREPLDPQAHQDPQVCSFFTDDIVVNSTYVVQTFSNIDIYLATGKSLDILKIAFYTVDIASK